jgi:uncharacterized protein (DUF1330 family)
MKDKNTRNNYLILILIFVLAAAMAGYHFFNEGPVNVVKARGIKATTDELYTSYVQDSIAAAEKYGSKVVEVTGVVSETIENTRNQQVILLKTANAGGNINCTMEQTVSLLKTGDRVKIKGICNGLGEGDAELGIPGDVYLSRSVISK